ncbi:rhomboid family intramembrane serine protease [Rhodococcus sp. CH91]|uniref:rhomboid family intramembrane serine protease n=1 Tax=Rhodococcus sp. CH91 TaxID=2910256 RepID=UPI001F4B7273|nr:rhomboid family intramembrane serine protease [Rhodococcus sp. CH91]
MRTVGDGRWWTLWTSGLFASGWAHYVVASIVLLGVAVPVEHRLGSRRFAFAAVLCQGLGVAAALLVALIVSVVPNSWGLELHRHLFVDPLAWICGTVLVATATMRTLWRRRIRAVLLVLLVTGALFAGHLQDVARLGAAVAGLLVGPMLVGRPARAPALGGTIRERRTLVALVVAASVLGPMFAAFSPQAIGPLSALRELFDQVPYSPRELVVVCADPALYEQCREGRQAVRLSGIGPWVMNLMPSLLLRRRRGVAAGPAGGVVAVGVGPWGAGAGGRGECADPCHRGGRHAVVAVRGAPAQCGVRGVRSAAGGAGGARSAGGHRAVVRCAGRSRHVSAGVPGHGRGRCGGSGGLSGVGDGDRGRFRSGSRGRDVVAGSAAPAGSPGLSAVRRSRRDAVDECGDIAVRVGRGARVGGLLPDDAVEFRGAPAGSRCRWRPAGAGAAACTGRRLTVVDEHLGG